MSYPAFPYQASANYSSHHCIGGNDYSSGFADRSCVFHHVCHLKGEGDILHYYVDPELPLQPILAENDTFSYDFGKDYVIVGPYPERFSIKWSPTITESSIPLHLPYHKASRHIFFQSFCEANPGEFMNVLHAVYGLPMLHGYEPNTDIMLLDAHGVKRRTKHRDELLHKGLSDHESKYLEEMGDVCFETLFAGSGFSNVLLADHMVALTADRMKEFMWKNLNFIPPPIARHSILVLVKNTQMAGSFDGNGFTNDENHILNVKEVVAHLKKVYGHIATIKCVIPDSDGWHEQFKYISSSTVIVTAAGGGSFGSFFAQKGASVVFLDRRYRHSERFHNGVTFKRTDKKQMEDSWWTHLNTIKTFHYPVCNESEMKNGDIIVSTRRLQVVVCFALLSADMAFLLGEKSHIVRHCLGRSPKICEI